LSTVVGAVTYYLPTWTVWPPFVERGFVLVGQYSFWLDPWIPMKDFWQAFAFVYAPFFFGFLLALIFSRSFRLKIFKH